MLSPLIDSAGLLIAGLVLNASMNHVMARQAINAVRKIEIMFNIAMVRNAIKPHNNLFGLRQEICHWKFNVIKCRFTDASAAVNERTHAHTHTRERAAAAERMANSFSLSAPLSRTEPTCYLYSGSSFFSCARFSGVLHPVIDESA